MDSAVLVDIDGTIADMGKGQFKRRNPYDWHRVNEDTPIVPIIELVQIFRKAHFQIIFVSGRSAICQQMTETWLMHHAASIGFGPTGDRLFMRAVGDCQPDELVKREIYDTYIKPVWNVCYILDDRAKVVKMWRNLGLTTLAVADGDF